jgi:hypothetical protein
MAKMNSLGGSGRRRFRLVIVQKSKRKFIHSNEKNFGTWKMEKGRRMREKNGKENWNGSRWEDEKEDRKL